MEKNFYVGLDIGTKSIGWAVTDENYNLMRKKGKDLWGSYLFDEAQTSAERRSYRTARRRLARAKHRILLLQELFAEEIAKVDMGFYPRLENSKYFIEDKAEGIKTKSVLFNDSCFNDKDYYKQFKTIFHLRNYLINNEVTDVRLLYLAIHHILKNRGHFLYERDFDLSNSSSIRDDFATVSKFFNDNDLNIIPEESYLPIFELLCDKQKKSTDKQKEILSKTRAPKDKHLIAMSKALTGYEFKFNDLFETEEDFSDVSKLKFNDSNYETNFQSAVSVLGEERANIIACLKRIYDLAILQFILNGHEFISEAKVDSFESHKKDLLLLKEYVRSHCPQKYKLVFRKQDEKVCNYARYIGMDKQKGFSKCSKDDFYKFLKKEIDIKDENILSKIENGTFLQKQISGENCVIPYQVHLHELKAILANAEKYFPFLSEKTDGLTVSEKIISLMTFRVPYYVGPFTTKETKCSWMVKKDGVNDNEKITPWNFDKIVDKDACEQVFITRMTNKCTYLVGEDVLPASSLLYSEFSLLNELNNLKVNGERSAEAKNVLFNLAHREKKLTLKKCCNELIREGLLPKDSKPADVFTGTDGDLKGSLSSYIDLKRILGDLIDTNPEMCEEIIKWITIVSDKNRLAELISKKYGDLITSAQVKELKGLNYGKWGRLSKELLTETFEIDSDGEYGYISIIEAMRNGTENLMELLGNKHGYARSIDVHNSSMARDEKVTYRTIDNLYCSPAVKRGIWNTVKLVKEIIKIEGNKPKKVFIEMTRSEDKTTPKDQRRTKSRMQKLQELYNGITTESDWTELFNDTDAKRYWTSLLDNIDERKLNSGKDRIYLWFLQCGRDIYTGKTIDINDVLNPEIYDIDHIYPQSKIKDDSFNNRVLVSRHYNQFVKKDYYPLPQETRTKMLSFWKILKGKGFISEEKFYRLTRSTSLTIEECSDFIDRQLVFTSQTTKAVAEILKNLIGDSCEVVYSKASNVNDFKREFEIIKLRELNDLHHAKDAYLNIVVGNVYNTKFNHNAKVYFQKNGLESYNLKYLYTRDIPGAWKVGDAKRIKEIVGRNTCKVVRATSVGKGKLFNATIQTATDKKELIPLKANGPISDYTKYGGYHGETTAYFMIVKSIDSNGNQLITLEYVSVLANKNFKSSADKIKYCIDVLNLQNPIILIDCIKINTLFKINGSYAWLSGRSGSTILICNAKQLVLQEEYVKYLKLISNDQKQVKKNKNETLYVNDKITAEKNIVLYDVLKDKLETEYKGISGLHKQSKTLDKHRDNFIELSLQDQCKVIMEIVKLLQCNALPADLSLFKLGKNLGKATMPKNLTGSDVKVITQSMTGYYKKVVDIKDLL